MRLHLVIKKSVEEPYRLSEAKCLYPRLCARFEELVQCGCVWHYRRSDGVTIAPELLLLPNGDVDRYFHFNESRWEKRNGWICFVNEAGLPSPGFIVWN